MLISRVYVYGMILLSEYNMSSAEKTPPPQKMGVLSMALRCI